MNKRFKLYYTLGVSLLSIGLLSSCDRHIHHVSVEELEEDIVNEEIQNTSTSPSPRERIEKVFEGEIYVHEFSTEELNRIKEHAPNFNMTEVEVARVFGRMVDSRIASVVESELESFYASYPNVNFGQYEHIYYFLIPFQNQNMLNSSFIGKDKFGNNMYFTFINEHKLDLSINVLSSGVEIPSNFISYLSHLVTNQAFIHLDENENLYNGFRLEHRRTSDRAGEIFDASRVNPGTAINKGFMEVINYYHNRANLTEYGHYFMPLLTFLDKEELVRIAAEGNLEELRTLFSQYSSVDLVQLLDDDLNQKRAESIRDDKYHPLHQEIMQVISDMFYNSLSVGDMPRREVTVLFYELLDRVPYTDNLDVARLVIEP